MEFVESAVRDLSRVYILVPRPLESSLIQYKHGFTKMVKG